MLRPWIARQFGRLAWSLCRRRRPRLALGGV